MLQAIGPILGGIASLGGLFMGGGSSSRTSSSQFDRHMQGNALKEQQRVNNEAMQQFDVNSTLARDYYNAQNAQWARNFDFNQSSDARNFAETQRQFNVSRDYANRVFNTQQLHTIQNRVADAKAAGLHPLFALGAAGGSSPSISMSGSSSPGSAGLSSGGTAGSTAQMGSFIPGQSSTGSHMDDAGARLRSLSGVADAFSQYADLKRQKRFEDAQIAQMEAQRVAALASATADFAQSQRTASSVKRAGESARVGQDVLKTASQGTRRVSKSLSKQQKIGMDPFGLSVRQGKRMAAQDVSEYYGDPGDWIQGGANIIEDTSRGIYRKVKKYVKRSYMDTARKYLPRFTPKSSSW